MHLYVLIVLLGLIDYKMLPEKSTNAVESLENKKSKFFEQRRNFIGARHDNFHLPSIRKLALRNIA